MHYQLCFIRETLLGQLSVFIKQTRDNFVQKTSADGKGIPKGKNVPEAVNNISWVQQLIAKVLNLNIYNGNKSVKSVNM